MGVAGRIVELAQLEVDRWAGGRAPRGGAEVARVADYFSESLRYTPANPRALEGLGAVDLGRIRLSRSPAEALAFTRQANMRFREALRVRPTSPYLWANLALSKLYLDEVDDEFFSALKNADELGPWEPASQQTVLFASLAAWDRMGAAQRLAVRRAVERGGYRNALKVFEIVKKYRRFDLVCGLASYDPVAAGSCGGKAGLFPEKRQAKTTPSP